MCLLQAWDQMSKPALTRATFKVAKGLSKACWVVGFILSSREPDPQLVRSLPAPFALMQLTVTN